MNIQTLLLEIKQAKKRRVVLDYHCSPVSGVDVPIEDWQPSLVLLRSLFKAFKVKGCNIVITWWGQIFIIPKNSHTAFELALNYQAATEDIASLDALMSKKNFIKLRFSNPKPIYTLSIKAHRAGTKWYRTPLDINKRFTDKLAASLYEVMTARLNSYQYPGLEVKNHVSDMDDIEAIIHYAAAKFGANSQFYRLSKAILSPLTSSSIELTGTSVVIKGYYPRGDSEFYLKAKEIYFIMKYLPS